MNLRKDLIRLASTMAPGPERTQLIQVLADSKTPDGGDAPDEGGGDEGSEDPNEHPGEGDGGDDEDGIEAGKNASFKTAAGSGAANAKYLSSQPPAEKAKILKHIAKHYGTSVPVIEREVTDRDAENLFEYTATDRAMTMEIYRDFKRQGLMRSGSLKTASFPYLDPRSKNLAREGIRDGGLTKEVMRSGKGFALYNIDKGKNHSKFYEGMVMPDESMPGSHRAVFRWGAMTDNGFKGRVDGKKYDEKFRGLSEAQALRALQSKKLAKIGRGYIDTFGPKHVDRITGKRMKQGEYPVGLARGVGFGWGVQEMAFCVPALRGIGEQIAAALDPNDGTSALVDLKAALRLVKGIPDSTMAGKITKYIGATMREINKGPAAEPEVNRKLRTLKNYIDKQVALCD